jgi:hypothetical protein
MDVLLVFVYMHAHVRGRQYSLAQIYTVRVLIFCIVLKVWYQFLDFKFYLARLMYAENLYVHAHTYA